MRSICWIAAPLLVALCQAEQYFPPPDANGGWRTLADPPAIRTKSGIDTAKLDQAFQYIQQTSQHGGLLVVRHGYLVYERYFGRGHREALPELASCGKAFTSIAVGIMLKEKASLIPNGLDEKVFTPKYFPAEFFPLDDPRKARISLGQLLSMSAGVGGTNPVYVRGVRQTWEQPTEDNGPYSTTDGFAMRQSLWCAPGDCYSYSTASSHLPAMIVRRLTGMEMEDYMRLRLTTPLGFGTWGYAMYRPKLKGGIDADGRMLHTPGGGSIAVRSTDVLRFAYLMLHQGKWGGQQIVPAGFVKMCGRMVSYNPHSNHTFNFNVNEGKQLEGVPADAYWKGGAGGYAIYVVPSLDMVIYKMGGTEAQRAPSAPPNWPETRQLPLRTAAPFCACSSRGQYDPALTRLPVKYSYDGSRANWKPGDPKLVGDSTGKTLQIVVSAVRP